MKASVSYNDFVGTAAADVSDGLGNADGDTLKSIGQFLGLDGDRFKMVGLSIYGTDDFYVSLICVDKHSRKDTEEVVSMSYDVETSGNILDILFKRLHIVLHDRYDEQSPKLDYAREVRFSDYHKVEGDEEEI